MGRNEENPREWRVAGYQEDRESDPVRVIFERKSKPRLSGTHGLVFRSVSRILGLASKIPGGDQHSEGGLATIRSIIIYDTRG